MLPSIGFVPHRKVQPRVFQTRVDLVQTHAPALGDRHCLVQVSPCPFEVTAQPRQRRPGQETTNDEFLVSGLPQSIYCAAEMLGCLGEVTRFCLLRLA
jgi:hypothetical protein